MRNYLDKLVRENSDLKELLFDPNFKKTPLSKLINSHDFEFWSNIQNSRRVRGLTCIIDFEVCVLTLFS
jgi:hypothetical protein